MGFYVEIKILKEEGGKVKKEKRTRFINKGNLQNKISCFCILQEKLKIRVGRNSIYSVSRNPEIFPFISPFS